VKIILVSGNLEAEEQVKFDKFLFKDHLMTVKDEVEKLL